MRTKILLTGATGFLGSHLLERLLKNQMEVVVLKRATSNLFRIEKFLNQVQVVDLTQTPVDKIFEKKDIHTILHCATDYGRKQREPSEIVEANLLFPLRLLHAGLRTGIHAFVNTDTILDKRISPYSLSKRQFVEWLKTYAPEIAAVNVALEHFYGPEDDKTKFLSMLVDKVLSGAPSIPLTMGEQKRDFVYITDVVNGFEKIVSAAKTYTPGFYEFEIGSGRTLSIRELAEKIIALLPTSQTTLSFGELEYRSNEVMNSQVNLKPLQALGWRATVSLEEGLTKMIQEEQRLRIK